MRSSILNKSSASIARAFRNSTTIRLACTYPRHLISFACSNVSDVCVRPPKSLPYAHSPSLHFSSSAHVYIHPLSQIVLEHVQSIPTCSKTFEINNESIEHHKDGTFTIQIIDSSQHVQGKIWTSYDANEKKHWLTVHKGDLVGRYLLQDNMKPAWHSDKKSVPDKIRDALDEMMKKMEEEDE